jgi:hypothetical protein
MFYCTPAAHAPYARILHRAVRGGWKDEILSDFNTLRAAGHAHPDMDRIEELLTESFQQESAT